MVQVSQCVAANQETGEQCKSKTGDSTKLCAVHRHMLEEKNNDKILKCHRCMRTIWKDAKEQIPDIEKTRMVSCAKAFWRSNGDKRKWMRDLCWFDIQTYSIDYRNTGTVLDELIGIVRDERLRLDQTRRYMADEGGLLTPDYIRMMQQHFGHLKDVYLLQNGIQTGPFGNLKNVPNLPAKPDGPLNGGQKKSLLEAIFNSDDGIEEVEVRKTTVESQTIRKNTQPTKADVVDTTSTTIPQAGTTSGRSIEGESHNAD